jgi:hypothetical protein
MMRARAGAIAQGLNCGATAALAAAVRVDRCFESPWELFRFDLFNGLTLEEASGELEAWCRRQRIAAEFEIRKARGLDVVYVILRARLQSISAPR